MKRWIEENEISFYNLDNRPEELVFNEVLKWMKELNNFQFEKVVEAPYCNFIKGSYEGIAFTLMCDFEDGTDIICNSASDAQILNRELNHIDKVGH
ncbi:MAG: hypothetical protein RSD88_02675 [Anaerovoracaceae bacterium]